MINVAQKSPTAIAGNPITYPNQASLSCSHQGGGGAGTTGLISYQFYINCGAITPDGTNGYDISNPRFGISDVEPKLFGLSAAGTQSVESAVDVTFAPVVSRNFYKALQDAQGLTGTRTVQRNATTTAVVTCTDTGDDGRSVPPDALERPGSRPPVAEDPGDRPPRRWRGAGRCGWQRSHLPSW